MPVQRLIIAVSAVLLNLFNYSWLYSNKYLIWSDDRCICERSPVDWHGGVWCWETCDDAWWYIHRRSSIQSCQLTHV